MNVLDSGNRTILMTCSERFSILLNVWQTVWQGS